MAKEKKASKPVKKKKVVTAEEKLGLKAAMKTLKAAKDEALKEGDKKKIKAVRIKLKKVKRKLTNVAVPPAPPAAKEEAAPAA